MADQRVHRRLATNGPGSKGSGNGELTAPPCRRLPQALTARLMSHSWWMMRVRHGGGELGVNRRR
jgi:hypothetical protein